MTTNELRSKGARLVLSNVEKSYKGVKAVSDVNIDIAPGEFVTMLGPSGSGKTTTLNIIAGFVQPDSGKVELDGRDITTVQADKRNIGIVFQNYALFPHMDALRNVMFPLEMRGIKGKEARHRAMQALEMVELSAHANKRPNQLSGGQQQRVALARSFVFEPGLLLMDEPLGALDKNLRKHMQIEIMKLCKRVGSTVVFVTHDQEEALTMSDRVAVYNAGRIEQLDDVQTLYDKPKTTFVAGFIGESCMLDCSVLDNGDPITGNGWQAQTTAMHKAGHYKLALRPEMVKPVLAQHVSTSVNSSAQVQGKITESIYLGSLIEYVIQTNAGETLTMRLERGVDQPTYSVGDTLAVTWDINRCALLPAA